jgi:hypothetical protein
MTKFNHVSYIVTLMAVCVGFTITSLDIIGYIAPITWALHIICLVFGQVCLTKLIKCVR